MQGKIIKGIGGFYYVETTEGIIECKARGVFRKNALTPLAGDNCEIAVISPGKGNIEKILDRKNALIRPPAANIDNMFIVTAAADPDPALSVIDKLTVIALKNKITPYIVINKTDLNADYPKLADIYKSTGFTVFTVCTKTKEGIGDIPEIMKNKVSVIAGCSGVGKSSLLNVILPQADRETGETSKINRGKHTTREVELIAVPGGGYIADSPGFSNLTVEDIKHTELEEYFPEFSPFEGMCRFRGCSHINEPDCEIKKQLKNGIICQSRYDSYCQLYLQFKEIKQWQK